MTQPRRKRPANVIQINFDVTTEEHRIISHKAAEMNMSLASYCRFVLLNANFKITQNNS